MTNLIEPRRPYNLKRWILDTPSGQAHFYTCGRPGREESQDNSVSDDLVHCWVLGLGRHCGTKLVIVSLLGRKNNTKGKSELSYYSFCGGLDTDSECKGRPTFQEWLNAYYKDHEILVSEHPTFDYRDSIRLKTLEDVKADILKFLSMDRTIVVMDSGGVGRTRMVCDYIGAKEDSATIT